MSGIINAKRIVVKIGTSTLTHKSGHINIRLLEQMVKVLADLRNTGKELILVSSGAVGIGAGKLGFSEKPSDMPTKQAAAAVGQCELMYLYDRYFSEYNHTVGQILLTKENTDGEAVTNICNTFERLLSLGVIPIVNENDTVSTEEIKIGDNDTLSAIVAKLTHADCLVIMTDIDGLYTGDPHSDPSACLVPEVEEITEEIIKTASGAGSKLGTGGMLTKLYAAQIITGAGADMYIINGKNPALLYDLLDGISAGTHFKGVKKDGNA